MKTFIKFFGIALVGFVLTLNISACTSEDDNDDDNNNNIECCTYTETEQGITVTYTACEDGSLTITAGGIVIDDTPWNSEEDVSWDIFKALVIPEGAVCN